MKVIAHVDTSFRGRYEQHNTMVIQISILQIDKSYVLSHNANANDKRRPSPRRLTRFTLVCFVFRILINAKVITHFYKKEKRGR